MTGRYALVFPGQGAQKVGMGRELFEAFDAAHATFSEADAALGEPLSRLVFEGPPETLTMTANTQPSIVTVSVAVLRVLAGKVALAPAFVAGHSLGEYSALVASGAMSFADAVRTTRARGTFMQEAVPAGHGAMAAVMKKSEAEVAGACARAAEGEVVSPANFNSPDQIVISGHAGAVGRASEILKEGGGRVIPLKVSAPFHCALMHPAAEKLGAFLGDIRFGTPAVPIVTNVEAAANSDAARIRDLLVTQVTSPVRWTDSVRFMISHGVTTFVELGPGNVLAGLIGKIDAGAKVFSAGDSAGIDIAAEALASLV
jgi:[acyl-carrier-protein] S-malonyltransferase